jgi:hypothetical protein
MAARLAWVALAASGVLVMVGEVQSVHAGTGVDLFGVAMLSFPAVGALIVSRQPDNKYGWILLAVGGAAAFDAVLLVYAQYALTFQPGSLPRPDLALALSAPMWVPVIGLMGTFVILLFPDGRLPSPRWRPWAWLCGNAMILSFIGILIAPNSFADLGYPGVENPLGIEALRPVRNVVFAVISLIPISIVGCAVALIRRYRRSRGEERLQLKWLAAASGAVATIYLMAMVPSLRLNSAWGGSAPTWLSLLQNLAAFSFVLIPVAVGIAILKYRLYDIDVVINKTLVFGLLTAVLAGVYAVGVVGLGGALRELTGQQNKSLVVAASTLAVAALLGPARAHIQGFIDRRFFRSKYDAAKALESFSARLRDEVSLDTVSTDLLAVVNDTMQPAHASLWLRQHS